jgi:hypothetical protein
MLSDHDVLTMCAKACVETRIANKCNPGVDCASCTSNGETFSDRETWVRYFSYHYNEEKFSKISLETFVRRMR